MSTTARSWIEVEAEWETRRRQLLRRALFVIALAVILYVWIAFVVGLLPFSPRTVIGKSGAISFLSTQTGSVYGVWRGLVPVWYRKVCSWSNDGLVVGFVPQKVHPLSGDLILQNQRGELTSIDRIGDVVWRYFHSDAGKITKKPALMVTRRGEGSVGIDADGKAAWSMPGLTQLWMESLVLPLGDRFYLGRQDFERNKVQVSALDLRGNNLWSAELDGEWVNSVVAGANGVVFMSTETAHGKCGVPDEGRIYGFDRKGKLLWQLERTPYSGHPVMQLEGSNLVYRDSSTKEVLISQAGQVIGEREFNLN